MPRVVDEAIARLQELADELRAHGWTATLQTSANRAPCLYVRNPETGARALAERIYCAPRDADRDLWFWWSWFEPITRDTAEAAGVIMRALRSGPALLTPARGRYAA